MLRRAGCGVWIFSASLAALPGYALAHGDTHAFAAELQPSVGPVEVRLPDGVQDREGLIGLERSRAGAEASHIRTYGQIVPDARALVDVNTYVSGQVAEVYVRPGDSVRKGAPIMSIFNPEFITTQKGYLQFLKNEEKLQVLREEGRLPDYLKDAKENLRWWGMSDKEIADLIDQGKVVEHILLTAPTDGYMTELAVQPGSLVNAGDRTMKQYVVTGKAVARMVASGRPSWVEGYVYPDQQARLRAGLPVRITLADGRTVDGSIAQLLPMVDPVTQRARFLVELGKGLSGVVNGQTVDIELREDKHSGTWVPRQSVLGQGFSPAVYVRLATGRYRRTPVTVTAETTDWLQVKGLSGGEQVVVAGKMVLEGLYRMSAQPHTGSHDHDDDHHH